jgi:hypothetical protein
MFEGPKEDKELGLHKAWIGAFVLIAVIVALIGFRAFRGAGKGNAQAAAAVDTSSADPVKDLQIQRATMQKDSLGTTSVWLVVLANKSDRFTYTNITYQTQYIGPDNKLLLENNGTIPISLGPSAEKSSEIRDTAYPAGVAFYRFKVTGAKAKVE